MSEKPIRSAADAVRDLLANARPTDELAPMPQSAQEGQNYQAKPVHPCCGDCQHLQSTRKERTSFFGEAYVDRRNMRCGLGGFRVTKMAVCDRFERANIEPRATDQQERDK